MNPVRESNNVIAPNASACAARRKVADAHSAKWFESSEPTPLERSMIRDCNNSWGRFPSYQPCDFVSPHIFILFLQRYFFAGMAATPSASIAIHIMRT